MTYLEHPVYLLHLSLSWLILQGIIIASMSINMLILCISNTREGKHSWVILLDVELGKKRFLGL